MPRSFHKPMPTSRTRPTALALAPLLLALAGCITIRSAGDGIARARIGGTVRSGPLAVAPTALVEDSRCPEAVQCIRAGTVRIAASIDGVDTALTLGTPVTVGGGAITLVEAYPPARAGVTRYPDEYRFGFRWDKSPARR